MNELEIIGISSLLIISAIIRAGLLDHGSNPIALTRKGNLILRIVDLLK